MQDRLEQPLAALVDRLVQEFPGLISVYRFGSFDTEHERPESDLDLAVYAGGPLPVVKLWRFAQELAAGVGRDVDLVDLAAASTVMRAQVIHGGERIHCADEFACETFEDYAYASYARLNEERSGILQDILRRRSVYG
jgi:predicted nucleotidyltransferase